MGVRPECPQSPYHFSTFHVNRAPVCASKHTHVPCITRFFHSGCWIQELLLTLGGLEELFVFLVFLSPAVGGLLTEMLIGFHLEMGWGKPSADLPIKGSITFLSGC